MKRYMLLLSMLIIGALLTNACSDDKSTNKPDETSTIYFPSDIGNYWIYMNETTTNYAGEETYEDSTVIISTISINGKNASFYKSYIVKDSLAYTRPYSTDGVKLYSMTWSLFKGNQLKGELISFFSEDMMPEVWVAAADARANGDWTIFKQSYDNYTYEMNDKEVTISGDFEVIGTNKGNIEVQTPAGTFDAVQNDMTIKFTGTMNTGLATLPLNFEITSTIYFSENIGIVKTETKKQSGFIGEEELFEIPQSSSVLLRYNVAK